MATTSNSGDGVATRLARELAAVWPSLSKEGRQVVLQTLGDVGVSPCQGIPLQPKLREACALPESGTTSPASLQLALLLVLGFVRTVERVAWTTWRTVAPQSFLRSSMEISRLIGRVVTNGSDAEKPAANEIQRLSELIGAIISAVPTATQVSAQHWRHLMPKEIRTAVDLEAPGKSRSDERCWRKYEDLAVDFDEQALKNEVWRAVALHVDRLVSRPNSTAS